MNFLVLPIFFLSGALYPLDNLPSILTLVTRIDPLTYGIDGLRASLINLTHFGLKADLAILCGMAIGTFVFWRVAIFED